MPHYSPFATTPYGSTFLLPVEEQQLLFESYLELPTAVRVHLAADETGEIIGTIARRHDISEEQVPGVSLCIFQAVAGRRDLAELLSVSLALSMEQASILAQDLEKELITPIHQDVDSYWQQQERGEQSVQVLSAAYAALPAAVRTHLELSETMVILRDLLDQHGAGRESIPETMVLLLAICTGRRHLAELPEFLTEVLSLKRRQAQALALAIEGEVLAPIRQELEEHWRQGKKPKRTPSDSGNPPRPPASAAGKPSRGGGGGRSSKNVLDLKRRRNVPKPPPMPKKKK